MKSKILFILIFVLSFSCRTIAETRTDSRKHREIKNGTFKIVIPDNDIKANFIGKIIEFKLNKRGFTKEEVNPQFLISTAYTVNNSREIRKANSYTNTYGYTNTTYSSTQLYFKNLALIITDTKGTPIWEGQSTEEGWCPNIISTAPELVVSIFNQFPNDSINKRQSYTIFNEETKEIRNYFKDTDWSCD